MMTERRRGSRIAIAVAAAMLIAYPAPVAAEVQVSDLFRKIGKRVIKELGVNQMKSACAKGDHLELCQEFVGLLADFAIDAVEGELDTKTVIDQFREFASRALVAIALDELGEWLGNNLPNIPSAPETAKLRPQISAALRCVAKDLVSRGGTCTALATLETALVAAVPASAKATLDGVKAELKQCTAENDNGLKAICLTRAAVNFLAEHVPQAGIRKAEFETVARVIERVLLASKGGSLFAATVHLVAAFDELDEFLIAGPYSHRVFDASKVALSNCPKLSNAVATFKANVGRSYDAHARAILRGESIDSIDASLRIPWDPTCTDPGPWWGFVKGFRFQASMSAAVHRFEQPALLGAALIDYVRSSDERQLGEDTKTVLRFTVARWIGQQGPSPKASQITVTLKTGQGADPTLVDDYADKRFGLLAGHRNCVVQLMDALLGVHQIVVRKAVAPEALCWLDESHPAFPIRKVDLDKVLAALELSSALIVHPDLTITPPNTLTIMRWDPSLLLPPVDPPPTLATATHEYRRLRVAPQLDVEEPLVLLEAVLAAGAASTEVQTALRLVRAIVAKDLELANSIALEAAGKALEAPVTRFVDRLFGKKECPEADSSARCVVRAVALAFFEPLTQVIAGTRNDQEFVLSLARRLNDIDALDASMILFDVGLGYSSLYVDPGSSARDEWSQHFTVLDKWGIAYKGKCAYAGLFAGGFIDAIIKTASDEEEEDDARWLLGGTVGLKNLGSVPLGLSLHVAWALPIDWENSKAAFVIGGSLNVPVDFVLED